MKKKELTSSQHFVPQAYLKNFAIDPDDRKPSLWAINKKNCSFSINKIRNVCTQNFFYDITKSELEEYANIIGNKILLEMPTTIVNEEQPLENFFANVVEGMLFNHVKEIIELYNQNKDSDEKLTRLRISEEELYLCALYAYYQWLRTPSSKRILDKSAAKANAEISEILDSYIGDQTHTTNLHKKIEAMSSEFIRKSTLHDIILDAKHTFGMTNILSQMYKWIFLYSEEHLFLTSDNPTIFEGFYSEKPCNLYFPLTPNICICLINKDNVNTINRVGDRIFVKANEFNVHAINMLTYYNADRFVFSSINPKNQNDVKATLWN